MQKNSNFTKFEFWAATTLSVFLAFFFIVDGFSKRGAPFQLQFQEAGIPFDFYKHYYFPQLARNLAAILAFFFVNFKAVPNIINGKRRILYIVLFILVFLFIGSVFAISDISFRPWFYQSLNGKPLTGLLIRQGLDSSFTLLVIFLIYTAIKYLSLFIIAISPSIESKYRFVKREGTIATMIWIIVLLVFMVGGAPRFLTAVWIMCIPTSILLYLLGFYQFIPASLNKSYPLISYVSKNALILFLALMAWGLILKVIVGGDQAHLAALWIFNSIFQICIITPLTWLLYKRQVKGNEQLNALKKELKQSNASFDFLRSQINPHFLFNVLNTIYGTALQEKAERTGEAVQKLGDMMRFMLQENMLEKISLAREVAYLNNYIDLQKLRTASHPLIKIKTDIQEINHAIEIAPMLLIPFVENAFKHGISFREPSCINIALQTTGEVLTFAVHNSKHDKHSNDLEADKTGIGLLNVKQRLELLYPGKHELLISETEKVFFIRLMIQTI